MLHRTQRRFRSGPGYYGALANWYGFCGSDLQKIENNICPL